VAAEQGGCVLVAQHSDRFARGDGLQAQHLAELWFAVRREGVEMRTVQDDSTFTNPLLIMALGERNTEDSRRKGLAVRAGMKRAAEGGRFVGGRVPYGYRADGRGPERSLVKLPAQAKVVQTIFSDYVSGVSLRAITTALNESTPSPRGGVWRRSTVSTMLGNVVYTGKLPGDRPGKHRAIIDEDYSSALRRSAPAT
jgi:DNA invertase Pin-like site-specific DNA recombinase